MTQYALTTLDLPALHRHAIGFDRMFEELTRTFTNTRNTGTYPPYNIFKQGDNKFYIEIAVAGFSEKDLDISLAEQTLTITCTQNADDKNTDRNYLHQGISARDWQRTFHIYEMEVKNALVKNGILTIELEHVIPEEKKPKKIAITFNK